MSRFNSISRRLLFPSFVLYYLKIFELFHISHSLQLPKEISSLTENLSRRDALLLGGGSLLYGKIVADAISRVGSGFYPPEHEQRVASTFQRAIIESAQNIYEKGDDKVNMNRPPLRILEVGIGEEYRTVCNGSYNAAFQSFFSKYPNQKISLTGLDFLDVSESTVNSKAKAELSKAQKYLQDTFSSGLEGSDNVTFDVVQGDICAGLPSIPDGYFDVVTCCLLLCSVADQEKALREIKRILRPTGGGESTFT